MQTCLHDMIHKVVMLIDCFHRSWVPFFHRFRAIMVVCPALLCCFHLHSKPIPKQQPCSLTLNPSTSANLLLVGRATFLGDRCLDVRSGRGIQAWSLLGVEAVEQVSIELCDLFDEHVHVPEACRQGRMPSASRTWCRVLAVFWAAVSAVWAVFFALLQDTVRVSQTCLGHKPAFWRGTKSFFKKCCWVFLGSCAGEGGAPSKVSPTCAHRVSTKYLSL